MCAARVSPEERSNRKNRRARTRILGKCSQSISRNLYSQQLTSQQIVQ